jgi:hypothetical protein
MKKSILLLSIVAVALLVSSCNKETEDNNSLAGTTWLSYGGESGLTWTETLTFTSASSVTYNYSDAGGYTGNFIGTYVYNPPAISITALSGDYKGVNTGSVNGDNMFILDSTFTKQ